MELFISGFLLDQKVTFLYIKETNINWHSYYKKREASEKALIWGQDEIRGKIENHSLGININLKNQFCNIFAEEYIYLSNDYMWHITTY